MQRPSGRVDTGAGNNSGRGVAEGEEEQARWASRETGTTYGVLDKCGQRAGNGLCSNTLSCVLHRACVLRASCVRRACVVLLASCLLLRVSLHEKCEVAATAFRLTSVGWRLGCSGIVVDAACRQARATSQCKSLWSVQVPLVQPGTANRCATRGSGPPPVNRQASTSIRRAQEEESQ